jgi:glycosyltransferase involved in cell wall biosynthesis
LAITIHDFIPEKLGWLGIRNPHIGKKALCKSADLIICVSQQTAQDLDEHYGISDSRVHVIRHGVDDSFLTLTPKKLEALNTPRILYVGHRRGYKNFDILVQAIRILRDGFPQFKLDIAGSGLDNSEVTFLNQALGPENWFSHRNPSNFQLKELYLNSAVHCVTSRMEGFGMTILESMIVGTPVVLSDIPVFREIAEDAGIYFDPNSPEELSQKISEVVHLGNYLSLSQKTLERARQFSWAAMASNMSEAYRQTIA